MSAEPRDDAVPICDAVTLEVIRGALRASQSEMEALIERTAMSGFIREKKDFFVALFDASALSAPIVRPLATRSVPFLLHIRLRSCVPATCIGTTIVTGQKGQYRIRLIRCFWHRFLSTVNCLPLRKVGLILLISVA